MSTVPRPVTILTCRFCRGTGFARAEYGDQGGPGMGQNCLCPAGALTKIQFAANNSEPMAIWMQKVAAHAMRPEQWLDPGPAPRLLPPTPVPCDCLTHCEYVGFRSSPPPRGVLCRERAFQRQPVPELQPPPGRTIQEDKMGFRDVIIFVIGFAIGIALMAI